MIPEGPIGQVFSPKGRTVSAIWIGDRQGIIQRHIADHCHTEGTDKIEQATDEQVDRIGLIPLEQCDTNLKGV